MATLPHEAVESGVDFECRICRDNSEPLVWPCRCPTPVHVTCLRQWVATKSARLLPLTPAPLSPTCEICLTPYMPSCPRPVVQTDDNEKDQNHHPTHEQSHQHAQLHAQQHQQPSGLESWRTRCFGVSRINQNDPLGLQPKWSLCDSLLSIEGCLFLFLFVLAVTGHSIFLLHMYDTDREYDEYRDERLVLAFANAILSCGILAIVQRSVSRWLREGALVTELNTNNDLPPPATAAHSLHTRGRLHRSISSSSTSSRSSAQDDPLAAEPPVQSNTSVVRVAENENSALVTGRPRARHERRDRAWLSHIILGGVLSLTASAEVYFLLSAL